MVKKKQTKKEEKKASKPIPVAKIPTEKIVGIVIIIALVAFLVYNYYQQPSTPPTLDGEVKVELFVMSHCPYGTAAEDTLIPAAKELGVPLRIEYITTETPTGFNSLHGQPEVDENIIQLCALEDDHDKGLDFILCRNKDIKADWNVCAAETGVSISVVKACFDGPDGKKWLSDSAKVSTEKQVSASPTIFVNGEPYSFGPNPDVFKWYICDQYDEKPDSCANVQEPKEVTVKILVDERCLAAECNPNVYVDSLKYIFPGLKTEVLDYQTPEGEAFYNEIGADMLPLFLFDKDITEVAGADQLARYLTDMGDYKRLAVPAEFDPNQEICGNEIDDNEDGKIDCDDAKCENDISCNKRAVPEVELFIMSHCPYGTQTMKGIVPVVELLGDKIDFELDLFPMLCMVQKKPTKS